jgi:RNA polymerase sigma-70 factor (ECF subfamily)
MVASMANGQPAFMAYQRDQDGTYQPHAVHVLTLDTSGIADVAMFRERTICAAFTRSTDVD